METKMEMEVHVEWKRGGDRDPDRISRMQPDRYT